MAKEKEEKYTEKRKKIETKFYHNCSYRKKNGTNKLMEPGKGCIFGGTNSLHYREV